MRPAFFLVLNLILLAGRAAAETATPEALAAGMVGTYSTAEQARADRNFRDITLHVARIWTERPDGPWLYLEQALSDAPEHPYRQRVCQLASRADGLLESRVFELTDPVGLTGAWQDITRFGKLNPTSLVLATGCNLIFQAQPDGSFRGRTAGNGCATDLRGASYSTNETTIGHRQIITWERGYNSSGVQVWGSLHGGFIFKKTE